MRREKPQFYFVLLWVAFFLAGVAEGAQKKPIWTYVNGKSRTYALEAANVYAEPDLRSILVGRLKKDMSEINVESVKILTDVPLSEKDEQGIREMWWYISSPEVGWVEGPKLAAWGLGLLSTDF